MSLKALIVDDEEYSRKSLYYLVTEHCTDVDVASVCCSVSEAIESLSRQSFDIIFLDIAMPGENGFDLVPLLQEKNIDIIFTTAYDQYALKALKSGAIDYLLKPIDISELIEAVRKCVENRTKKTAGRNLQEPTDSSKYNQSKKIRLHHLQGFELVDIDEIIYVEADSNYSVFYLENNTKSVLSKPLKDVEELLNDEMFFRVHKSAIVNLNKIKTFSNKNDAKITLRTGVEIPVSRRRLSVFQEHLKFFLKSD